jgi:hypothetical protein
MSFGGGGSGGGSISSSSDVALSNPANGQVLTYSSTLGKWQNATNPTAPVSSVAGKTGAVVLAASDVGLGNVDNTSDADKPISTAVQTALDAKADASSVGSKVLLIDNAAALPAGTPAGVIVVVKS